MVRLHGRLCGLLPALSGWSVRDAPDTVFQSALRLHTVPAQGSSASLLRAHGPIPGLSPTFHAPHL
jgi:hypothetical protein